MSIYTRLGIFIIAVSAILGVAYGSAIVFTEISKSIPTIVHNLVIDR